MSQHTANRRAPARSSNRSYSTSSSSSPRPSTGRGAPRRSQSSAPKSGASNGGYKGDSATRGPSDLDLRLDAALAMPEPPRRTFAELGLPKPMVLALGRRGITEPFAIQTRALPDALEGKDVLGRAQTGSGKTLAFGLPMLVRLGQRPAGARSSGRPRGLVLVPTRELARQVADNLVGLAHTVDIKVTMIYGGAPMGRQISALKSGVDVVVATPGRLLDLLNRGALTLSDIEITVLDEADHMADLGFLPDVRKILDLTAPGGQRLLFSATLDRAVERLVREYLPDPVVHAVESSTAQVETMDHLKFVVNGAQKLTVAAEIAARPARTLFFVATKRGADRLALQLHTAGVPASAIHGNLNQNQRQRALDAFGNGHPRVLVATDVAARGIHVDDVDLVVHFDPPTDGKAYLHRSGRTARAGSTGTVISLVTHEQSRETDRLHRTAGVRPVAHDVAPGHEQVRTIATSGTPIVVKAPVLNLSSARSTSRSRPGNRPNRRRNERAAG